MASLRGWPGPRPSRESQQIEASILDAFALLKRAQYRAGEPVHVVLGDRRVGGRFSRVSLRVVGRRRRELQLKTTVDRTPADIENMSHPNTKKMPSRRRPARPDRLA